MPTIKEFGDEMTMIRRTIKNLSANTLRHDEIDLDYANRLLGNYRIDQLTCRYINKRYALFKATEGISSNVLNRTAKMFKRLYRRAVVEDIIETVRIRAAA